MSLREALDQEQLDLFTELVEAYMRAPREHDRRFMAVRIRLGKAHIQGNGILREDVPWEDIEALVEQELFRYEWMTNTHGLNFTPSPRGKEFYRELMASTAEQTDQVEEHVWRYFDSQAFRQQFPTTYTKWSEASDLAWGSETQGDLSKIGHVCREAMQEFATELIAKYEVQGAEQDPALTRRRFSAVVNARREAIGERKSEVLDALFDYWVAVGNLIQRQEHAGQRQGSGDLTWEDGRRAVFQLGFVMFEAARTLEG
jgi:hypothetical protein